MKKRIFIFIIAVFILVSFFRTNIWADQEMSIDVNSGVKYIGHSFDIYPQIFLDGQEIDTYALRKLHFDVNRVNWQNTNVLHIFPSQAVLLNEHDDTAGTVRIDVGKNANTANYVNSSWTHFAQIRFLPINTGTGANGICTSENGYTDCKAHFSIDFDGTPGESGVFLGGVNLLDNVVGLDVVLQEDSTPPVWSDCNPTYNSTDVPVTTNVYCSIRDFETGVYLSGTYLRLWDALGYNDTTFHNFGANTFSTVGISNGYRISLNPSYNLPYDTDIFVFGSGQDNAYNNGPVLDRNTGDFNTSGFPNPYKFHTEKDVDAPEVYSANPHDNEVRVPTDTAVEFKVHDIKQGGGYPGMGVDINSLAVTISASGWGTKNYDANDSHLTYSILGYNTPYHNPYDYDIVINPETEFPQNVWVTVHVEVDDMSPDHNHMVYEYKFLTADTLSPVCYMFSPAQGSTDLSAQQAITFKCIDTGVGIDINSFVIHVDGTDYTASGLNNFVYSGTPASYVFTINAPENGWTEKKAFEVIINGSDFAGNYMDEIAFGLSRGLGSCQCSSCPVCPQCDNNTNVGNNSSSAAIVENSFGNTSVVSSHNVDLNVVRITKINKEVDLTKVYIKSSIAKIDIEGVASPNSFVMLMIESNPLFFTTKANSSGIWEISILNVFTPGVHKIFAVSVDQNSGDIVQQKFLARFTIFNSELPILGVSSSENLDWLWILLLILLLLIFYLVYKNAVIRREKENGWH